MIEDERRLHVAEVAARGGCDTTKKGVLDALAGVGSFDVQACPGSGKTTTVAAKVVVVLDGWRGRGGMCVVTHTNVAREEIQKHLRRSDVGRAALDSPHFVGTIQSFVNAFLAFPYLRFKAMPVEQIDNDAFAAAADQEYRGRYHKLRFWFSKQQQGQPEDTRYRTVEYGADGAGLKFDGKKTGFKNTDSASYLELADLKEALTGRGIFRHADMYHFANRYLDEFPWAVDVLRRRFPVVLVDEMQDTNAVQDALLNRLFPPDAVTVQRFGDENQKIFGRDASEDETTSFPRVPVLQLGESQRFGEFIADRIATIAPSRQTILGDPSIPRAPHTILLFDEASARDVIPRFAEIAESELRGLDEPPVVKAIGNRKRPSGDGGKFPNSIGDYVDGFVPDAIAGVTGREGLRLRVERAKAAMERDGSAGAEQVMIAVRMLIARWGLAERPREVVGRIMRDNRTRRRLGAVVTALLSNDCADAASWSALVRPLHELLAETLGTPAPAGATAFLGWTAVHIGESGAVVRRPPAALALNVEVQSIHSVKGENHHATLVLETQYKKHDVSMVLRYLAAPPRQLALGPEATMHHRRMFVAMSRPRRLLCMAASAAHVDAEVRAALIAQGWIVEDLSDARP